MKNQESIFIIENWGIFHQKSYTIVTVVGLRTTKICLPNIFRCYNCIANSSMGVRTKHRRYCLGDHTDSSTTLNTLTVNYKRVDRINIV